MALQSAFKCYVRTRDYCTSPKHILSMCLAVIKTAIELRNYLHVANYVAKAEQTPDVLVGDSPPPPPMPHPARGGAERA